MIAAAATVLAILAYRWWSRLGGRSSDGYVDRGASTAATIEQTVAATGTVNPVTTVQVGTYVSGPILALDVDFNSPVKKGQRVAKIDPAPFAGQGAGRPRRTSPTRARGSRSRAPISR